MATFQSPLVTDNPPDPREVTHPPEELTRGRLCRLGEGIGKVIYASEHWVVKRERSPFAVVALIVLWKLMRRVERHVPGGLGRWLLSRPARQIRFMRALIQATMLVVPKSVWFTARVRRAWRMYHRQSVRGEELAQEHLAGTGLVPETIRFPPTRVRVGGWPGWLTVSEATERIEATLYQRLVHLAADGRFEEVELWLDRFLDLRQKGWRRGLFAMDAHLKNFGVTGDRVVLLDTGGLTNRWADIVNRLAFEDTVSRPHVQLGLGAVLNRRPDIAERFDAGWRAVVTRSVVERHWPNELSPPDNR